MQFVRNVTNHPKNNNIIMGSVIYNKPNRSVVIPSASSQTEPSKKSKWGEPTWFFFHTLAHKIKDEYIETVLPELFKIIVLICSNLPCPTCTKHASEYMKKVKSYSIVTRDDLKLLLFQFHNEVNMRKGYPLFEYKNLDEKYEKAITKNIIYHFFYYYRQKDFNISMIANNMHREQTIRTLQSWLSQNIFAFHD